MPSIELQQRAKQAADRLAARNPERVGVDEVAVYTLCLKCWQRKSFVIEDRACANCGASVPPLSDYADPREIAKIREGWPWTEAFKQ